MEILGNNLNRLCTTEFRMDGQARGVIQRLAAAAEALLQGPPVWVAARTLHNRITEDDVVILTAGVFDPLHLPLGETDGPQGIAALARTISLGIGGHPLILCEDALVPVMESMCREVGLGVVRPEELRRKRCSAVVLAFPTQLEAAQKESQRLISAYAPKAVISSERLAPNRSGVLHSATGKAWKGECARVDRLFDASRAEGIITIGIGDNGNEIGFGAIEEVVRAGTPFGGSCLCECSAGTAAAVGADIIVPVSISNWGCYGIAGGMAALLGDPTLLLDSDMEASMLRRCRQMGVADGATGRLELAVDGVPLQALVGFVDLLRAMVENSLRKRRRDF